MIYIVFHNLWNADSKINSNILLPITYYLSIYLSIYQFIYLSIYLPTYGSTALCWTLAAFSVS
jgi:hypothetical protein